MTPKKADDSGPSDDADEFDEIVVDVSDDDFDFDGRDVSLDSIPSWIEDEPETAADFDEELSPRPLSNGEQFHGSGLDLGEDDGSIDVTGTPDATDLFADNASYGSLAEVQEQRDAYLGALRQLQADFENYKKRVIRDNQEFAEMKSVKLMEDLLPVLDNFQLALKTITGDDDESENLRKGIELVYCDLYSVLERQGLEPIDAEGALFDPELHDAVSHEHTGEHDEEVVIEVLRPGYKVRGRVVRPAMVKVAQ